MRWHFNGRAWLAGDHSGKNDVLAVFSNINMLSGGTFKSVPVELFESGDRVVSYVNAGAEVEGRSLTTTVCLVWEFADGKVIEVREHIYDVEGIDWLWGDVRPG